MVLLHFFVVSCQYTPKLAGVPVREKGNKKAFSLEIKSKGGTARETGFPSFPRAKGLYLQRQRWQRPVQTLINREKLCGAFCSIC